MCHDYIICVVWVFIRRRLVEEAKAKEEEDDSGEYLYRVRGPPGGLKIVKIRKRD